MISGKKGKARKNPPGRKISDSLRISSRKFGLLTQMQEIQYTVSQEEENSEKKSGEGGFPQGQKSAGLPCAKENPDGLIPASGDTILYLGAGHGTTISHLHDMICGMNNNARGRIIGVDIAPRCLRDLTFLANPRPGLIPVLGDARKYSEWQVYLPNKVDWIFQDVAQSAQVDIFLGACDKFLNKGGTALLSLKAASERWTKEGEKALFQQVEAKIKDSGFEIVEAIDISRFEENHVLFHCIKV